MTLPYPTTGRLVVCAFFEMFLSFEGFPLLNLALASRQYRLLQLSSGKKKLL
jgi:hypothetical protein